VHIHCLVTASCGSAHPLFDDSKVWQCTSTVWWQKTVAVHIHYNTHIKTMLIFFI